MILGCEALEGGRGSGVHEIVCDFKYGFPTTLLITLINKLGSRCEDLLYFTTALYKRHLRTHVCLRFLYCCCFWNADKHKYLCIFRVYKMAWCISVIVVFCGSKIIFVITKLRVRKGWLLKDR